VQVESIRDWFEEWSRLIRAVDYEAARRMFADDVVGFGTHMRLVNGLDELETEQWRAIWGRISDFRFVTETMSTGLSQDGLNGWGLSLWTSTGYDSGRSAFTRPGRATVLLSRSSRDAPWLGIHTHVSLVPGTAQRTYGVVGGD
jgi:ketosteroid isomerase-like protein